MIFFQSITLEAFRGFAAEQTIPLGADAVVITGSNGLGKTSLVDGITWALTGDIAQMSKRQDKRNEEYVVNQYRSGDLARVSIEVRVGGHVARITREGSSRDGSSLSVVSDRGEYVGNAGTDELLRLCDAKSVGELRQAVDGWGVLRQDELRAVLSAPAEDFQARLRDILGLGVLADFEQYAKNGQKRAAQATGDARKELAQARDAAAAADVRLVAARERTERTQETSASVLPQLSTRLEAFSNALALPAGVPEASDELQELADLANTHSRLLKSVARDLRELQAIIADESFSVVAERLSHVVSAIGDAEIALTQSRETLDSATVRLADLRNEADAVVQVAAAALPLIGDACPVCGQDTDPADVRRRLQDIVDRRGTGAALVESEDQVAAKSREVDECMKSLQSQRASAEELRSQLARRDRSIREVEVLRARVEQSLAASKFEFLLIEEGAALSSDALESTINALDAAQTEIGRAVRMAQQRSFVERVPALTRGRDEANERVTALLQRVEALSSRETEAKSLAEAAALAAVDVTEEALQTLDPYFGEVFGRLAAHPTFSRLGLEHEVYYGKARTWARISDPVTGLEVNPRIVCSEGQLNVVALSFFVAFALTGGDRSLPFVALDDPLQSLDDMNVLGFADLCRHLRDGRQLIVTTHDRRFGNLLLRKLTPRHADQTAMRIHFDAWDRSGPAVTATAIDSQVVPEVLPLAN